MEVSINCVHNIVGYLAQIALSATTKDNQGIKWNLSCSGSNPIAVLEFLENLSFISWSKTQCPFVNIDDDKVKLTNEYAHKQPWIALETD